MEVWHGVWDSIGFVANAIHPIMPLVTRLTRISQVGRRNELVVVWGNLRGGVALALAMAIPEAIPDPERFIAMTAGIVIATLVLNATTIGHGVQRREPAGRGSRPPARRSPRSG